MPGPLEGIKIVDASAYITGPMATMLLADQGAQVVKVEPTGVGDVMRHLGTARGGISTLFAGCNRSKRSLALDLRDDRGRDLLKQLVARADIFVQNFRYNGVELPKEIVATSGLTGNGGDNGNHVWNVSRKKKGFSRSSEAYRCC